MLYCWVMVRLGNSKKGVSDKYFHAGGGNDGAEWFNGRLMQ